MRVFINALMQYVIPFHKKYDVDVGWVEERNPTLQSLAIVGFH
jgi:hypothetical protein